MPMPLSRTDERSVTVPAVISPMRSTSTDTIAFLGKLDRVADQVDQHLLQAQRVADEDVWDASGLDCR
jgi:hypothetical protein